MSPRNQEAGKRRPLAALLSPCGTGNLGDAAIQDSILHHLRNLVPGAQFVGITLSPADTEDRHGIAGFPLDIFSRGLPYGRTAGASGTALPGNLPAGVRELGASARSACISFQSLQEPGVSALRRAARWLKAELRHVCFALRLMRRVDMLIISGGGQIDDLWGGARGHPLAMFKWTLAARLCRRRVYVVSVGAGHLRSRLSRWLVRRTLGLAQHATCRDRRSSRVVGQLRGREAPVVPDLALSYPVKPASGPGPASLTGQLRVGIAPMAFGDSKSWPEDRVEQFRNYIDSLTETARRLMQSGASVTLFSTTPSDARVARAVFESLRGMPTASDESNVALTTPDTVDSLLQVLQSVDLVIASRLHAVILATDCARPLVAIACEWKVERFMLEMGLKPYCRRFAEVNADDLSRSVNTLDANRESIAVQMREFRKQALTSIESQYETLAAALEGDSSRRNG